MDVNFKSKYSEQEMESLLDWVKNNKSELERKPDVLLLCGDEVYYPSGVGALFHWWDDPIYKYGDIKLNSDDSITLKKNRKYLLIASCAFMDNMNYHYYNIYNCSNNQTVGTLGHHENLNTFSWISDTAAVAVVTPSSDTKYNVRVNNAGNNNSVRHSCASYFLAMEIK